MAISREVGPFEVLEPLGKGGMGEVYKARDTRLNRFVALKFMRAAATDAARERFQREAMAIAALNHPHICTLHEIGDYQGRPYLVLELLEGETLKARLRRGVLDREQLLDWSVQISDALDAAHRKGVLHRDLKPENIWVAPGGHVKVLDFGLARLEAAAGSGETLTSPVPLTSPGVAMGTYPYMSPEQVKGEPLDARSDIFSFGSVFYEMASGRAAFRAASAAEVVAGILKGEPKKLRQVRPEVAPMIAQVVARCLEKEPDLRYQSAADLRAELKRLKRESGSASEPAAAGSAATRAAKPRRWVWLAVATACVLVLAAAWWLLRPRTAALPPPAQLQFRQLTFSGNVVDAVISPDGKFLAHADAGPRGTSLHLLSISSGSDVEIMPPAPGCCQSPSFSPDGGEVYFLESRKLLSVPVLGGAVRTVVDAACSGAGFSPDGTQIAYVSHASPIFGLTVAQSDGSHPHELGQLPAGSGILSQCWIRREDQPTHSPAWSPDGRWIATAVYPEGRESYISMISTASGQAHALGPGLAITAADLNWLPDSSGIVLSASIPDSALPQVWELANPSGRVTQLTDDLQGYAEASLSATGLLAVVHAVPQASIWAQTRAGGEFHQLPGGGINQDGAAGLAWTSQGDLVSLRDLGGKWQIWRLNAISGDAHLLPIAQLPQAPNGLQAAPNGQIVFGSGGLDSSIWRVNSDGTGLTELVHAPPGGSIGVPAIIRNGTEVAFLAVTANDSQTLQAMPLAGGTAHQSWEGFIYASGAAASPDGSRVFAITRGAAVNSYRFVVVRVDVGKPEVTTIDYKGGPTLGLYRWTADGRAIIFRQHLGATDNLLAFPLDGRPAYALTHFQDLNIPNYAVAPDGRLAVSRGSKNTDAVVATGLPMKGGGGH